MNLAVILAYGLMGDNYKIKKEQDKKGGKWEEERMELGEADVETDRN